MIKIGLDIGSTTAKFVMLDEQGRVVHSHYARHNARAEEVVVSMLEDVATMYSGSDVSLRVTGSVGMGFSERYSLPFVQEVVAATHAIK